MASGVEVKGSGLAPTLKFIRKMHGDDVAESILNRIPEPTRGDLAVPMASKWYPVEHVGELCGAIKAEMGTADRDLLFAISRQSAKDAFNLIYKVFFKLGSPSYIVNKVASVWSSLCSKGQLTVPDKSDKHIVVRLSEFPYDNPDYCEQRLRGWFQAALEVSGCDITVSTHTQCVSKGAPHCEWRFEWN